MASLSLEAVVPCFEFVASTQRTGEEGEGQRPRRDAGGLIIERAAAAALPEPPQLQRRAY